MEGDNGGDLSQWLLQEESVELEEDTFVAAWNGVDRPVKARLKGNLLLLHDEGTGSDLPLLVVLERVHLAKEPSVAGGLFSFSLAFSTGQVILRTTHESTRENWMIKLATASQLMAQAHLDSATFEIQSRSFADPPSTSPIRSKFSSYFLTQPFKKGHSFTLSQPMNTASRTIHCSETMYESKLSLILPMQLVKHLHKCTVDHRSELETRLWYISGETRALLNAHLQHLGATLETLTQCVEFLDSYSPCFRPSVEKDRIAFVPVPTNLHVQQFDFDKQVSVFYVTVGCTAALPLRFQHGGLLRLKSALGPALASVNSRLMASRRAELIAVKQSISSLTRLIAGDCFYSSKESARFLADIKQLAATVQDSARSTPGCEESVDELFAFAAQRAGMSSERFRVPDVLENQLDNLDAALVSLDTKIAVLHTSTDHKTKDWLVACAAAARISANSCLDLLFALSSSLLDAHLLRQLKTFTRAVDITHYHQWQLRGDLVLCQAITIVVTALLTAIEKDCARKWDTQRRPLITVFSFLSCYGDERAMLEDVCECWRDVAHRVRFRFVLAASSVAETCVPLVQGDRIAIDVVIPLPAQHLTSRLSPAIANGAWLTVCPLLWNIGVNHEATLSYSLGDSALEMEINRAAIVTLDAYVVEQGLDAATVDGLVELRTTVQNNPSNKNMSIFRLAMTVNQALDGVAVLSCKSGKDRTSMAVTLEEGRVIRENCAITHHQAAEIIACLRRDGVRRENCRKNVGKPLYAFSAFQLQFLPKELRPPPGTFGQVQS